MKSIMAFLGGGILIIVCCLSLALYFRPVLKALKAFDKFFIKRDPKRPPWGIAQVSIGSPK
jgi:hypothetical protein